MQAIDLNDLEFRAANKQRTLHDKMSAITKATTSPSHDTPLGRYLAERSITPLPASTPTQPRAMATPRRPSTPTYKHYSSMHVGSSEKNIRSSDRNRKLDQRRRAAESPTPKRRQSRERSALSSRSHKNPKRESSMRPSNSFDVPSRKRAPEDDTLSVAAKRRLIKENRRSPLGREEPNDHYSTSSSRVASPVRIKRRTDLVHAKDSHSEHKRKSPNSPRTAKTHRRRAASSSPVETKKHSTLLSVKFESIEDDKQRKRVCYNYGQRGHWFMDCLVGCGKCGVDGHRTIDCLVVRGPTGNMKVESCAK